MSENGWVLWENPYTLDEVQNLRGKGNQIEQRGVFVTKAAGTTGHPHAKKKNEARYPSEK